MMKELKLIESSTQSLDYNLYFDVMNDFLFKYFYFIFVLNNIISSLNLIKE